MAGFDLSDEQWAVIEQLLPRKGRGPALSSGRAFSAYLIIWKPGERAFQGCRKDTVDARHAGMAHAKG